METDEHGILTEGELENVERTWINARPRRDLGDIYEELMWEAAKAQHDHDVAALKSVENPYPGDAWRQEFQKTREIFLKALKG